MPTIAAPVYDDLILQSAGLIGYWPLGEFAGTRARDRAKNILSGTYTGGFTLGKAGPSPHNSGVLFNGSTGWVSVASTAVLNLTNTAFSIEAWVKRAAISVAHGILSKGSGAYYFRFRSDNVLDLVRSSQADVANSTATLTDTTAWHHVAVTYAGANGTVVFYIDGVNAGGGGGGAESFTDNSTALAIGADNAGGDEWFNGSLARVALYSRVLGGGEIADRVVAARDAGA